MTTLLHLPFDVDAAGLTLPLDMSPQQWPVSLCSMSTEVTDENSRFGGASLYIPDENSAGLLVNHGGGIALGSGDFTIQCWVCPTDRRTAYPTVWSNYNAYNPWSLALFAGHSGGDTSKYQVVAGNSGFPNIQSWSSIAYHMWRHLALVRNGNTLTLFVHGVAEGSCSVAGLSFDHGCPTFNVGISMDVPDVSRFVGYIDDLCVDNAALYTEDFTPPAAIAYTPRAISFSRASKGLRYSPYEDGPPVFGRVPPVRRLIENTEYGGRGTVVGTVERKGSPNAPLARRVRLLRDRDAVMVGESWSNAAGQFAFTHLDAGETYTALAYDHTGEFESVCASRLNAEVA